MPPKAETSILAPGQIEQAQRVEKARQTVKDKMRSEIENTEEFKKMWAVTESAELRTALNNYAFSLGFAGQVDRVQKVRQVEGEHGPTEEIYAEEQIQIESFHILPEMTLPTESNMMLGRSLPNTSQKPQGEVWIKGNLGKKDQKLGGTTQLLYASVTVAWVNKRPEPGLVFDFDSGTHPLNSRQVFYDLESLIRFINQLAQHADDEAGR